MEEGGVDAHQELDELEEELVDELDGLVLLGGDDVVVVDGVVVPGDQDGEEEVEPKGAESQYAKEKKNIHKQKIPLRKKNIFLNGKCIECFF